MAVNIKVDRQILAGLRNLEKLLERRERDWVKAVDRLKKRDKDLGRQLKEHRREIEKLKGKGKPRRPKPKPKRPKVKPKRPKARKPRKPKVKPKKPKARPGRPKATLKKRVFPRRAGQPSLNSAIASLLRARGPLKPFQIANLLLEGGYKTKSKSFANVVRVRLTAPEFRRTAAGAYTVKK